CCAARRCSDAGRWSNPASLARYFRHLRGRVEPVSALDASVQLQILNRLADFVRSSDRLAFFCPQIRGCRHITIHVPVLYLARASGSICSCCFQSTADAGQLAQTTTNVAGGLMRTVAELPNRFTETENCWIPLPGGIRLAAKLWLPEGCDKKPVPTLVE